MVYAMQALRYRPHSPWDKEMNERVNTLFKRSAILTAGIMYQLDRERAIWK